MTKYVCYLLYFIAFGSYALTVAPASAETVTNLDSKTTNTINQIFSEQTSALDTAVQSIGNLVNSAASSTPISTNGKQVVVSESESKASDSAVDASKSNSNQRVPLPSRIFDTPSMQQ